MKTSAAAIRYDFLTNTLYVTKAYLDAAGIFGSPEYKEIKKYRDDNAGMKIEVVKRTASKSENRPVTVKYADMEHFIRQFPQERQEGLIVHIALGVLRHCAASCCIARQLSGGRFALGRVTYLAFFAFDVKDRP